MGSLVGAMCLSPAMACTGVAYAFCRGERQRVVRGKGCVPGPNLEQDHVEVDGLVVELCPVGHAPEFAPRDLVSLVPAVGR